MYSIKELLYLYINVVCKINLTLKGIRQSCLLHIAAISKYMQIFWIMHSALGPHCWKFDFQSLTADDTTKAFTQLWQ